MEKLEHIIQNARVGIDAIERERRQKGLSLYKMCEAAEAPDNKKYWRMVKGGDVKLSWFIRYARATGYEIALIKREEFTR